MSVTTIDGGLNNEVFAVDDPVRGRVCRKVFKQDGRDRETREWRALQTLARLGVDFAPTPIDLVGNVMLMSWVEGQSMSDEGLSSLQLDALFDVLSRLYSLDADPDFPPVTGNPSELIRRITESLSDHAKTTKALGAAQEWIRSDEPTELAQTPMTVLGRGDPNLANCLWDGERVVLIDWEYSGRTSRAFELGDHVEHLRARAHDWTDFIARFQLDSREQRHFMLSRRALAVYWLLLLQPGTRGHGLNPPGTLEAQEQRVLGLLES